MIEDHHKARVVLVCGGRHFADYGAVDRTLRALCPCAIVHGGASGADGLAGSWAADNGVPEIRVPANWKRHGRAAGPLRNRWMLDFTLVDLVVAFPGGAGTANMIKQARERGIEVVLAGAEKLEAA